MENLGDMITPAEGKRLLETRHILSVVKEITDENTKYAFKNTQEMLQGNFGSEEEGIIKLKYGGEIEPEHIFESTGSHGELGGVSEDYTLWWYNPGEDDPSLIEISSESIGNSYKQHGSHGPTYDGKPLSKIPGFAEYNYLVAKHEYSRWSTGDNEDNDESSTYILYKVQKK